MSGFSEYEKYDGLGLARLVQKKEVSPLELCEEAIIRIDRINPKINAVIYRMDSLARAAAKGSIPSGPFSGVPFLCKDLVSAIAGVPMNKGSKSCRNYVPTQDSEMARRHKAAGLIVLGKTNTPEFGLMGITEPELHGPTRNPWNIAVRSESDTRAKSARPRSRRNLAGCGSGRCTHPIGTRLRRIARRDKRCGPRRTLYSAQTGETLSDRRRARPGPAEDCLHGRITVQNQNSSGMR